MRNKTVYNNWKGGHESMTLSHFLGVVLVLPPVLLLLVLVGFALPLFLHPHPIILKFKYYYKLFINKYYHKSK